MTTNLERTSKCLLKETLNSVTLLRKFTYELIPLQTRNSESVEGTEGDI
jgi:hypothetical protein